jgi:DNA polymerase V
MIALVDCNACYVSCEQIFRPDLRYQPVIVLSNNDGCIIARSAEARALGIPDLSPYFKLKPLLQKHRVKVFSANFRLYGDISNQVMENLRLFSPSVEQYSIDEMFLGMDHMPVDMNDYALKIKTIIWRHVRMPVGVGVAPSKTLAKLANHAAKKIKSNNVAVLDTPEKWQWLQKRLPVNKVWGIGSKLTKRLEGIGIRSAYELAQADPKWVRRFTSVNVEKTIEELNGQRCIELEEVAEPKKEIFVTRSFARKLEKLEDMLRHVSRYAAAAAEKLRAQDGYCQSLYVFANTSRFHENYYANSMVVQLPYPTCDSRTLISFARLAMKKIYRENCKFNKCGVGLLDLRDRRFYQSDLFRPEQSARSEALMAALDRINYRYGRDTVTIGAEGLSGRWTMKQNSLSPAYTSSWQDLPRVGC